MKRGDPTAAFAVDVHAVRGPEILDSDSDLGAEHPCVAPRDEWIVELDVAGRPTPDQRVADEAPLAAAQGVYLQDCDRHGPSEASRPAAALPSHHRGGLHAPCSGAQVSPGDQPDVEGALRQLGALAVLRKVLDRQLGEQRPDLRLHAVQ